MPSLLDEGTTVETPPAPTPAPEPVATEPKTAAETLYPADPPKPADAPKSEVDAPKSETDEEKATREAAEEAAKVAETPEQKAAREAKEEAEKPKGAPESYEDFKVPEGQTLDTEAVDQLKVAAKELNIPQEGAQKFVDMAVAMQNKWAQAQVDNFTKIQEGWVSEVKADKEFGGEKLNATLANAQKAITAFGEPGLRDLLKQGLGDNPALVRTLARAGAAISEDKLVRGGKPAPKSAASVLYPSMKQ